LTPLGVCFGNEVDNVERIIIERIIIERIIIERVGITGDLLVPWRHPRYGW